MKSLTDSMWTAATSSEKVIIIAVSLLLPLAVPVYSIYSDSMWSIVQLLVAYGLSFDIISGCVVYNSVAYGQKPDKGKRLPENIKHALLHMQPLVVASFQTEKLLPVIGLYWFILYVVFVALFEPEPRVCRKVENLIITVFIFINCIFVFVCCILIENLQLLLYGAVNYGILAPLTLVQFFLPSTSQRLFGVACVIILSLINMFGIGSPDGFQWFIPVLSVKLFIGYNVREND